MEDVAWELGVSRATLYRLIELYKTFGTVDVLQPSATGRRSGTWVLPKPTEQIIEETIHNVYLKPTRPTLTHLVDCVHARCTEEGVAPPHRRTVRARVKAIDIRVRGQRRGERDIVKATTAVPGEYAVSRPLEVVQIDHAEIDIIVVDELTRTPLPGRPWLTLAIDVFSRVSSLTLTANLRLGPASVSSQNAQRREKSRSRAKTDRLDTGLLMRAVLGWLRGEPKHCSMAAIPTIAEEDARRPNREHQTLVQEQTRVVNRIKSTLIRFGIRNFKVKLRKAADRLATLRGLEDEPLPPNTVAELRRDMARLQLIREQIKAIEKARLEHLKKAPRKGTHPMLLMLAQIMGIGVETADMLVHEVLSRNLRDQRAVARYGGLTGAPDESGTKRREKGLARAGNARVRHGMMQLAWRWLMHQKNSELAQWYQTRTTGAKPSVRKTMIVALARKLLIALWRYVTTGVVPAGAVLRAAT